jgi:hypothetical protein
VIDFVDVLTPTEQPENHKDEFVCRTVKQLFLSMGDLPAVII